VEVEIGFSIILGHSFYQPMFVAESPVLFTNNACIILPPK